MYSGIDLTDQQSVKVRFATQTAGGTIEFRLDAPDGDLIGFMDIPVTGNWQNWEMDSVNIDAVSGVHDVYLVFQGGESYLFNLNWFGFSEESSIVTNLGSKENHLLSIYPNPTSGLIHFSSHLEYNLTDALGNSLKVGSGSNLDLSDQNAGLYFLEVSSSVESRQFKLIKK